ncbi:MAG TPA: phosphoribosylamine--glycine ligase [Candidatus Acidoferrum sp.]|jgi:phosphoribosylamine--glycine ligase|nr:phosphoribosylamine--glycine ligase [Candidatus Acidoferrum sp.]
MKVLVIGSGGREHAIVWKLAQNRSVEKIWCAPGNGGISQDAECVAVDLRDPRAAVELAAGKGADLTIVGPELPLVAGIADEFARSGLVLLGPPQHAAQLEGSKIFAKQFMERHAIPTAAIYGMCDSPADAHMLLGSVDWPLVIKADGLCAGKGVLVTSSADEAADFLTRLMEMGEFGDAGRRVLLEEGLVGEELSYIILTDGKDYISLAPTRDHKRAFDRDEGPNTGGMGAYSVDEILPASLERKIRATIVEPTLAGLQADHITYRGFLYFGLMLTADGPKVLEYNCRLGDPETEAIMLRADFDFAEACMQAATASLAGFRPRWLPGASACVVVASRGYPGNPMTGVRIDGLEEGAKVPGAVILHAGTRRDQNVFYTTGGRILDVCARGATLSDACGTAYTAITKIDIRGAHYRSDIGAVKAARSRGAAAPESN